MFFDIAPRVVFDLVSRPTDLMVPNIENLAVVAAQQGHDISRHEAAALVLTQFLVTGTAQPAYLRVFVKNLVPVNKGQFPNLDADDQGVVGQAWPKVRTELRQIAMDLYSRNPQDVERLGSLWRS